jgi:hypothetical protein
MRRIIASPLQASNISSRRCFVGPLAGLKNTQAARSKAPERPKLGLLVPVIDAILESDKTAPPKQRHTAKRIFERLRLEHRFAGGYTVVKDYVRLARVR